MFRSVRLSHPRFFVKSLSFDQITYISGQSKRKLQQLNKNKFPHCFLQIMICHCISIIPLLYSYRYVFSASNDLETSQIGFQNDISSRNCCFRNFQKKRTHDFSPNMDLLSRIHIFVPSYPLPPLQKIIFPYKSIFSFPKEPSFVSTKSSP
jgi:hypothetical protein